MTKKYIERDIERLYIVIQNKSHVCRILKSIRVVYTNIMQNITYYIVEKKIVSNGRAFACI